MHSGRRYNHRVSRRQPHRNIVLIGYPKSGKTTVGRELARRLHRPFIDIPVEVQRRQRLTVFQLPGLSRPAPPDLERRLIADLSYRRETVAALGCDGEWDAQTLEDLKVYAYVVFLDMPFDLLWRRIKAESEPGHAAAQSAEALRSSWQGRRRELEQCDLQLVDGAATPRRLVQVILHCFYT